MTFAALFAWLLTTAGGLILLMIWIIEYDRDFRGRAASRLPIPVVSAHALLALGGLLVWLSYILMDQDQLAWISVATLAGVAVLGLIMMVRWVLVYRTVTRPGPSLAGMRTVPPERHFPVPVVITHGLFGVTTIVLVLYSTLSSN